MSIVRVQKRDPGYSIIDNEPINDANLSMEATALLIYLLSKPNQWKANQSQIAKRFPKNTRNKISTAFKELAATGYARLQAIKNDTGKLAGQEYIIFERPSLNRLATSSEDGNLRAQKSSSLENIPPLVNTDLKEVNTINHKQPLDPVYSRMAEYSITAIKETHPHVNLNGSTIPQTAAMFERGERIDKWSRDDIRAVLKWLPNAPTDTRTGFNWNQQIQSPLKLRRKDKDGVYYFDKLVSAMKRDMKNSGHATLTRNG